jgi:hypothetical protein
MHVNAQAQSRWQMAQDAGIVAANIEQACCTVW